MEWYAAKSQLWFGPFWGAAFYETTTSLVYIVAIVAPLMLAVAYLTLWERKFIGWIQIRIGPNHICDLAAYHSIYATLSAAAFASVMAPNIGPIAALAG